MKQLMQRGTFKIVAGVFAGAVVISALVFFVRSRHQSEPAPTPPKPPTSSGPMLGTLMPWLDGSTLIFVPDANGTDNNGVNGSWVTLNPISNYQYSLCVQAGNCQAPTVPAALAGYTDPALVDAPLKFTLADGPAAAAAAADYCKWIQASLNTMRIQSLSDLQGERRRLEAALETASNDVTNGIVALEGQAQEIRRQIDHINANPEGCPQDPKWLGLDYLFCRMGIVRPNHLTPAQVQQIALLQAQYDDIQAREQALRDHLRSVVAALRELTDEEQALGDSIDLHCDVNRPVPHPQFVSTTPFLNGPGPVGPLAPTVLQSVQFCQSRQAFETLDLQIAAGTKIESIQGQGNTTCQGVSDSRIACSGPSGTNGQVLIGLSGSQLQAQCQAGSTLSEAGCNNSMHGGPIAGLDDWEFDGNGILVPTKGLQPLSSGGLVGPRLQNTLTFHGVMVALSALSSGTPGNGTPGNGAPGNGAHMPILGVGCPGGFYFDLGLQACVSLGASSPDCPAGYNFFLDRGCVASGSDGNYPGCPVPQVLNPFTGLCEFPSQAVPLPVSLPDCTAAKKNDQGGVSPGGGGVPCIKSCPPPP